MKIKWTFCTRILFLSLLLGFTDPLSIPLYAKEMVFPQYTSLAPESYYRVFTSVPSADFFLTRDSDIKNSQDYCIREMYKEKGKDIQIWAVSAERVSTQAETLKIQCQAAFFKNEQQLQTSVLYFLEKVLDYVPLTDSQGILNQILPKVVRSEKEPYIHIELVAFEPNLPIYKTNYSNLIRLRSDLKTLAQIQLPEISLPIVALSTREGPWPPGREKAVLGRGQLSVSPFAGELATLRLDKDTSAKFPPGLFHLRLLADQLKFPSSFKWSVATSGYQIEGGDLLSDWHFFEQKVGNIFKNQKSSDGPDHWNRVEEDTELLKEIGVNQYRMSIEWSRIEPKEGEWDETAVEHYRREVLLLEKKGIEPVITLWHSTLPSWVNAKGGWEWSGAPSAFARFASYTLIHIAPRVRNWVTLNEPFLYILGGYVRGSVPPGKVQKISAIEKPMVGILRAHAAAYRALKFVGDKINQNQKIRIGIAHRVDVFMPFDNSSYFDNFISKAAEENYNWAIPNALKTGKLKIYVPLILNINVDIPELVGTQDFFGFNYYTRLALQFRWQDMDLRERSLPSIADLTEMGWEMYPEGFYLLLKEIHSKFPNLPILNLENGIADGLDRYRTKYIHDHLVYLYHAIQMGIPVENYTYWSLYDNFEWDQGFSIRVGLYHTNYITKKRTQRKSALYYKNIIKNNSVQLKQGVPLKEGVGGRAPVLLAPTNVFHGTRTASHF